MDHEGTLIRVEVDRPAPGEELNTGAPTEPRAAATVIVTTEELITDEEIRRRPDRTVIPGFLVDALVLAPFGAYPHEVWGRYHADFDHFAEYTADIDARGVTAAVADYLARYVHGPATFDDYLALFGGERLKRAQDAARELTPGI